MSEGQEIDSSGNITKDASVAEKVFRTDELREEILSYAIKDKKGKISGKNVKNVRVVQKCWLQTTNKLLRKIKEPVIELTVDGNGSLNAKDDKPKEKLLDELVEAFGTSPRLQDSFLPVKLDFKLDFFRERNYQSFSDCLTRTGKDLVELQLEYPKDGGTMPVTFPPFSLPVLRKLSFNFSKEELQEEIDDEDDDVFGVSRKGLELLQAILNASKSLKEYDMPFTSNDRVVHMGFKYLQLPPTISELTMRAKLRSKDLEFVLRNPLPNLTFLAIQVHQIPFEEGFLFKIMERFQKTLEFLKIYGMKSDGDPDPCTYLRFPLMEKLTYINFNCTECELGPGNVSDLEQCLPELTSVHLMSQTKARLEKWTQNSILENVQKLSVSVINEQLEEKDENYYMSPGSELMAQLQKAFPNICNMSLAVNISDLSSLTSVFQNMGQLQALTIKFFGNEAVLGASCDLIDSVLLGLPLRFVIALKEDMELLDTQSIVFKRGLQPGIRNLTELSFLSLDTEAVSADDLEENGISLMSNLLFQYAFMEMTDLWELSLHGKFKPSLEMQKEWKRQGRFISYSKCLRLGFY